MKIGVLLKQVPDTETKIRIKPDASGIETDGVKYILNPYDEYAVEEALKTKEKIGKGEVVLISLGPARVVDSLRAGLAMGADRAIHIDDGNIPLDTFVTATLLFQAARAENFDLIFCGKQAIDDDAAQVPQMVAEFLDWPCVMVIEKFELWQKDNQARSAVEGEAPSGFARGGGDASPPKDKKGAEPHHGAVVSRRIGGGAKEIYEIDFPALFGCEKGLNTPRYASLPGIMKAKSKPLTMLKAAELMGDAKPRTTFVNYRLPPERQAGRMIAGTAAEQVRELVRLLREEAKVI